jgi:DNA-binding NarL/FixJ family response regulator
VGQIRVLLVDDYEPLREALVYTLGLDGLEVVGETGNGDDAIDLVTRLQPDVVVTDLAHPGFDGFEVIRRIRENALDVKVVVFSAFDQAECITRSLVLGADGYVTKDDSPHVLASVLKAIASGQRVLSPEARRRWKAGRYGIGLARQ